MAVSLPSDIFYVLGETVTSRVTLATLCRVSKSFNRIFTPLLYRTIQIQDCEFQNLLGAIAGLESDSHLRFTNELQVGRNNSFEGAEDNLRKCLDKMPDLRSLMLVI